MGEYGIP